jgi:hypothetical protein
MVEAPVAVMRGGPKSEKAATFSGSGLLENLG